MFLVLKFLIYMEVLTLVGIFGFRYCLTAEARKLIDTKVIALAVLMPAMGCLLRIPVLLYALLIVVVAVSGRKRSDVASIWIFLLPLLPALESPIVLGGTYLLRISTVLALNIGGIIGIMIARREQSIRTYGAIVPAIVITLLFIYIDGRQTSATVLLRIVLNALFLYLLPAPIITAGVANRAAIDKFMSRLLAAAFLCSTVAIFEAVRSWPLYQSLYPFLGLDMPSTTASLNVRGGFLRAPGPMGDPSALGLFLAVALCVAVAHRPIFRRKNYLFALGWLGLGLLATQSRGAILAAAAGACAIQIYRRRAVVVVPLLVILAVVKLGIDVIVPHSGRLAEIMGRSGEAAATADYRLDLFRRGLSEIRRHPIAGDQPSVVIQHMSDLLQGQHIVDFVNGHLYIALTSGLVGLAIWLAIWFIPLGIALARRPRAPRPRALPLDAVPGIIVTSFVGLTFTSIIDRNLIWPVIAFGLLTPASVIARQAQDRARHPARPEPEPEPEPDDARAHRQAA